MAAARKITENAERERRGLSESERRLVGEILSRGEAAKKEAEALDRLDRRVADLTGPASGGGSLFDAFKSAGFAPGKRATVGPEVLGKVATFTGDPEDLNPSRREGAPLGADKRFLADVFPSTPTGNATAVQVLRQSGRTLPPAAQVQRDPLAATAKAEVGSEREMVSLPIGQLAAKESGVPNLLLAQSGVRSMIDQDLRLAILEAKDAAIVDAIDAATPAASGQGADLTEAIVFAAAQMADNGYTGTVVAISPMDAAALSLLRGDAERFAREDPLAGFRFVATKSVADGAPLLIDPAASVHRYDGNLSLQSFEENDGATNTSLVRLEQLFAAHVERVAAIRRITETPA